MGFYRNEVVFSCYICVLIIFRSSNSICASVTCTNRINEYDWCNLFNIHIMSTEILESLEYQNWALSITNKIKLTQTRASFKVNEEMLNLYWEIGNSIIEQQKNTQWGAKVIDLLASDISKSFTESWGFSVRNLKYMRAFAEAYPQYPIVQIEVGNGSNEFVQVPLAQITWYHHISLISKIKDPKERAFYIVETVNNGWNRDVMLLQIQTNLYQRKGKAINNFTHTLPIPQSDLAKSIFKDPYNFSFLSLSEKLKELEIEKLLTEKITDFLLELGKGFAFVGRQYAVEVDDTDYKIDLLFYHTVLHAYRSNRVEGW
jgi:predicted nuclease of restriction endonuclease-like (RecB) superfamily